MNIRKFNLDDYEQVVDMFYELNKEVYDGIRKISPIYFYYKAVIGWINDGKHIVVAEYNNQLVGFTLAYIDDVSGLTEKVYNGELAYVRPKYRNGRASYMLYNNVVSFAKENNLNLVSNSRVANGVDKMVEKHFSPEKMFINFEKRGN